MRDIKINNLLKKTNITTTTKATAEFLEQQSAIGNPEKISELIKVMVQKELENEIKKLK